jgi:hypothetical protein
VRARARGRRREAALKPVICLASAVGLRRRTATTGGTNSNVKERSQPNTECRCRRLASPRRQPGGNRVPVRLRRVSRRLPSAPGRPTIRLSNVVQSQCPPELLGRASSERRGRSSIPPNSSSEVRMGAESGRPSASCLCARRNPFFRRQSCAHALDQVPRLADRTMGTCCLILRFHG